MRGTCSAIKKLVSNASYFRRLPLVLCTFPVHRSLMAIFFINNPLFAHYMYNSYQCYNYTQFIHYMKVKLLLNRDSAKNPHEIDHRYKI